MTDKLKEKIEENVTCPICLDRYKWPLTLSACLHSYCRTCIEDYVEKFSQLSNNTIVIPCPQCRIPITLPPTGIEGLTHNHTIQSIVDSLALIEQKEKVVAAVATSSSPIDNNDKIKTNDDDYNKNNDTYQQQILVKEKGPSPINMGFLTTSAFPAVNKRPPRPPPPSMPKAEAASSNTMLYPDITGEKVRLQKELDTEDRPMDFDPCKDGLLMKFGKYGGGVNDFRKPYGLAISPQGEVIVSDLGGSRILCFSDHGELINKIVADCDIHDIAVFQNGLILVATSKAKNAILRIYNLTGSILREYSGLHYNYTKPSGVAIGVDNYAVVTSLENNSVYVFTEQQKLSKQFGWKGAGNEHFNTPAFVTTNNKNYIIVSDMGNNCLKVFTMEGTFKYTFGQKGKDIGMLMSPMGICTDDNNNIIVADAGNFRIQAFSAKGRHLGCPLLDTFRIGPNVRPINVAMDRHDNIVVLLLGTQFAEVRTYLWTPPPLESLQDSFIKFTGSSVSKMFGNIAGNF